MNDKKNIRNDTYLETFGYPDDVRGIIEKIEGPSPCPAGYVAGDYIEYNHRTKQLSGPKGVCLHCLIHSGILHAMEHMRGREPHVIIGDAGWRRADGVKTTGKLCQCQGPDGSTVFWDIQKWDNGE